ncbi:hypothetical protein [Halosimplex sp. TS25]
MKTGPSESDSAVGRVARPSDAPGGSVEFTDSGYDVTIPGDGNAGVIER